VCQLPDISAFLSRGQRHFQPKKVTVTFFAPLARRNAEFHHRKNLDLSYDRKSVRDILLVLRDLSFFKSLEPMGAGTGWIPAPVKSCGRS
jgi:hypothetical protein